VGAVGVPGGAGLEAAPSHGQGAFVFGIQRVAGVADDEFGGPRVYSDAGAGEQGEGCQAVEGGLEGSRGGFVGGGAGQVVGGRGGAGDRYLGQGGGAGRGGRG